MPPVLGHPPTTPLQRRGRTAFSGPTRAGSASGRLLGLTTTALLAVAAGCDPGKAPESTSTTTGPSPSAEPVAAAPVTLETMRVVSLSPAMTQMLVDLGLGDRIVGRTPFCDSVPETVPIVGSLLDVDYEKLLATAPTHLVIQPAATGTDPEVERLAEAHHWVLIEQGLDRLADVDAFLTQFVAHLELPSSPALDALAARCESHAKTIRGLTMPAPARSPGTTPTRTVLLVGTDPPTAAGNDTFVSEMLVAAGGANAVEGPGYPELSLEDLVKLNPDAILVLRELALSDDERSALLRTLVSAKTEAAAAGRVELFVDPGVMLPSTKAPEVVARLRAVLDRWAGAKAR